jgi:NAD(P)-dependent dehydrogenase (short-subunit alcohol dehydrogenase family)
MGRLADKVAIVTGGASGFGGGIVDCFAREGARVLIADLNGAAAEAKAEAVAAAGGEASAFTVDVAKADQVAEMVAACVARYGGLDIMVANAGLGQRPTPLDETSEADYDRQFDVNVKGVFHCCAKALPQFRKQGAGNIIITASGIAIRPRPNLVVYGATKGAALNLAKGLALELAPEGIRVNALCPGPGDTPMLAEFMGGTETEQGREAFRANLPLGKLIRPQDMGEAAVFLADEQASSRITGHTLPVDSGRTV